MSQTLRSCVRLVAATALAAAAPACASTRAPAPAAAACPAPPPAGAPEQAVWKPVIPLRGGPKPPTTRTSGDARPGALLAFVVDTTGRADVAYPVRVVWASDSAYAAAARALLPEWRFLAAEVAPGCRVAQVVQMPFGRVTWP